MKTTMILKNADKINQLLTDIVKESFEEIRGEEVLLCMECCDVDLFVTVDSHEELTCAIKENFELDEFGEVLDKEAYIQLLKELDEYYVELHIQSGFYDYFPAGTYTVNGKEEETETDILAPKGIFYAPFEEAVKE
ncbi:hypothetical protein CEQ21_21845 [Niallia circulans]|uniref:Uncharacterized protein n=1 Tax=Niallia circulans TaxID=1397 RepID=A0A553SM38_NIACI|nr:hypothetical protein [Niallia circulans]TRZ38059.1 hypothetical protein CEQ21_21845 [Niallia circulans]